MGDFLLTLAALAFVVAALAFAVLLCGAMRRAWRKSKGQ